NASAILCSSGAILSSVTITSSWGRLRGREASTGRLPVNRTTRSGGSGARCSLAFASGRQPTIFRPSFPPDCREHPMLISGLCTDGRRRRRPDHADPADRADFRRFLLPADPTAAEEDEA